MLKEIIATCLLSGSISAKPLSVTVKTHINDVSETTYDGGILNVYGAYNFRESFTGLTLPFEYHAATYIFEDVSDTGGGPYYKQVVPFSKNDNTSDRLFLYKLNVEYDDGYTVFDFYCYNGQEDLFQFTTYYVDTLDNVSLKALMFNVSSSFYFSGDDGLLFNYYFTQEDNSYVVSYDGYFCFNNNVQSIPSKFCVLGSIMFNNEISYGLTNYAYSSGQFGLLQYDLENYVFDYKLYEFPLNKKYVIDNNFLFNGVKMSTATRTTLNQYGFFGYVRNNNYDNTDFHDMIFTLMDSPIYMISRLLNFELFGLNMFIALAGFLTICAILFLIRKFL